MGDPALEALWKNVLDRWEDDKAHSAFLEHCRTTNQLVEAAVRYRGMKGDRERGAVAEKRLSGVAILALATLESSRSSTRPGRSHIGSVAMAVSFALATFGLLAYLWYVR
jgi:hypothetical protein